MQKIAGRLETHFDYCFEGVGRRERREALGAYLRGLLLDGARKSMVPMASRLVDDPLLTDSIRQRLHKAISVADWDDARVYQRIATRLDASGEVEALILDGYP